MLVLQKAIETAYVQRKFLSVRRYFEHIVDVRIDVSTVNPFRALCDLLRDLHSLFARFERNRRALRLRHVQFHHIARLHIRKRAV